MRSRVALAIVVALSIWVGACETARPRSETAAGLARVFEDEGIVREIASVKGPRLDESGYMYDPDDKSCDGYPRLKVETAPGTCLGLVMPKDRAADEVAKRSFSMPRTLVQIPGTKNFLVADMGSWHPDKGALFLMAKDASGVYRLTLLKAPLNFPHAVKLGPDGKFWIGELNRISRFEIQNSKIANWETVVRDLPALSTDSHPLTNFTFDPRNNDLYINSGSPSDHCMDTDVPNPGPCVQVETQKKSAILKIPWTSFAALPAGGVNTWTRIATGLRNSMALVVHPSGTLIQGENARDFASLDEPFEELNVIDLGVAQTAQFHYGWPYCYDFGATSPEWLNTSPLACGSSAPVKTGDYQQPYVLIPPHAAPLAAGYYKGAMFNGTLDGKLLMSWHGYNPTGHRLVAYNIDDHGRPILGKSNATASYNFDRGLACPKKKPLGPNGGLKQYAPYTELVTKWNAKPNLRPTGAPVGFTIADDGSIFIAEDKNQTIVRLAKDANPFVAETCDPDWDERIAQLAWRHAIQENKALNDDYQELRSKLVTKYCASCHGGGVDKSIADDDYSTLDFLSKTTWFVPQKPKKSRALSALTASGAVPAMPPAGSPQLSGSAEIDQLAKTMNDYIMRLPTDVDARYGKSTLKSSRNIRLTPGGQLCGALPPGSEIYIDPRPSTFIKQGGWNWARVYLTPDHKALAGTTCAWPSDGVFAVATTQVK